MLQYMIKCASQNIITLKLFYAEWLLTNGYLLVTYNMHIRHEIIENRFSLF